MIGFRRRLARADRPDGAVGAGRGLSAKAAAAVALALAGCGPAAPPPATAPPPRPQEAGFVEPPRITAARRAADGSVVLGGVARPGAQIRLASPAGEALVTTTDRQGGWRLAPHPGAEAALFGLSGTVADRRVQAEGYVAVTPAPGRAAALLRAGAASAVFGDRDGRLALQTVDIDAAGAAVISGPAPAGVALTALVDGAPAGEAVAAAGGGYQLALSTALVSGRRRIVVRGGGGEAAIDLQVAPPRPPSQGAASSERLENAWRIDWVTPGAGLQTSFILDAGPRG